MRLTLFFLLGVMFGISACQPKSNVLKYEIENPLDKDCNEIVVEINETEILQQLATFNHISITDKEKTLPFQIITNSEGIEKILVLCDFTVNEKKVLKIEPSESQAEFKALTQAEISIKEGGEWVWLTKDNGNEQYEYKGGNYKNVSELEVPEQHTDHSFYIRYEGPGWESDKIGYRFYLDWRNAVDIFGKKTSELVLQDVGKDNFDSYHEMSDWGVDVLKVGDALGVGSIAHWADGKANRVAKTDKLFSKVDYSGVLESKITTNYTGWETTEGKTDLTSVLSIRAGSFLTKTELELSNPLENLCTGIVKHEKATIVEMADIQGEWAYLATFGVQTLQDQNLGMAVFYKKNDLIEVTEDELSEVVVLKPVNNKLTYYFGAAWELDSSGVKTEADFKEFLKHQIELLNKGLL